MARSTVCSVVAASTFLFVAAVGAQAPAITRTVLTQGDISVPGREAVSVLAELQPGAQSGRHTHPGEEVSYVMAGPVTIEIDGQPAKIYQTGEAIIIPAGAIHNAKNAGPAAIKLVNTYIVEKGKPLSTPIP